MVYYYQDRAIVALTNGSRLSYSRKRYGSLFDRVVCLSEQKDEKIWNYYEFFDDYVRLFYYHQATNSEQIILIDRSDFTNVKNIYWTLNANNYPFSRVSSKRVFLHNFIMHPEDGLVVDHINHNVMDARRENLRIVSRSLNNLNRQKLCGVNPRNGKWEARLTYNGKEQRKICSSYEEAVTLRRKWETEKFND